MSEQIGVLLLFAGLLAATVGLFWALGRGMAVLFGRRSARQLLVPLALLGGGMVVGAAPFAYQHVYLRIVGLGERERMLDGQRALNLTGWDRDGYGILTQRPDVVILEMGNPDVTDETLELLVGLPKLKELTLNDTVVTDAGLATLARLPALETLRIARTKITPEGLRRFLDSPPRRLSQLDVSGNGIPTTILRQWKNASGDAGERRYVN
ncbi:MAG: hypothetical protein ACKO1M_02445 [Planctomycetota bacterium]